MMETKAQKFERISLPRRIDAMRGIRLLGNLTTSDYESTPEQRAAIIGVIEEALDLLKDKWGVTSAATANYTPLSDSPTAAAAGPVSGSDKRAIRDGLYLVQSGRTKEGANAIREVVLGWWPEVKVKGGN